MCRDPRTSRIIEPQQVLTGNDSINKQIHFSWSSVRTFQGNRQIKEERGIRIEEQNSELRTDGTLESNPCPLYTESGKAEAECPTASNNKTSEFAKVLRCHHGIREILKIPLLQVLWNTKTQVPWISKRITRAELQRILLSSRGHQIQILWLVFLTPSYYLQLWFHALSVLYIFYLFQFFLSH